MQLAMLVTLVFCVIVSICATWPWHITHCNPAARCLRCVQVTPGVTWYTRCQGITWPERANSASFTIAGFSLAMVLWQVMHTVVAGNVI